jgi:uncharacterized membrane protein
VLVIPPVKVVTATIPAVMAEINPALVMPPAKPLMLLTWMPVLLAEIVPVLVIPRKGRTTGNFDADENSIFLARIIGSMFIAIGLGMLLNQDVYGGMIEELMQRPSPIGNVLIYVSGLLSLVSGLAMVNVHCAWTCNWRVIITVIGWLVLIGGILRIVLPQITLKVGERV